MMGGWMGTSTGGGVSENRISEARTFLRTPYKTGINFPGQNVRVPSFRAQI